jgi:DNA-binding response OmpR family regulator
MPQVLIIDDDVNIRVLLKKILASSGVEVVEAKDGAEGLSLAAEHHPDLILCDVIMPVMDGIGFLREWASRDEIAHIPVMMITSVTEKSRIIDTVKFGACDYIVKPFDPLGVRTKVGKLLKDGAARSGPT